MAGPVYLQGDNKHNFDVIQKHLDTLKEVHGPVYITENAKHSFSEVQKAAEQIKNLNHPVLNTGEAKNHFNQMISSAETLKNMNGRWINGSQETMVKFAILILQIFKCRRQSLSWLVVLFQEAGGGVYFRAGANSLIVQFFIEPFQALFT